MDKVKKHLSTFFFAIMLRGGVNMGRPSGTKNIMRSPEEKENIVQEAFENGPNVTFQKYGISEGLLHRWISKYRKDGIDGLRSKTGRAKTPRKGNPYSGLRNKKSRTREEELEIENLKLKVEVARLKKGYQVKGVGSKKEYVTIKDLNMKS